MTSCVDTVSTFLAVRSLQLDIILDDKKPLHLVRFYVHFYLRSTVNVIGIFVSANVPLDWMFLETAKQFQLSGVFKNSGFLYLVSTHSCVFDLLLAGKKPVWGWHGLEHKISFAHVS